MDVATVHLTTESDSALVLESARTVLETHQLSHATVQVESTANGRHCEKNVTW
jgi:cobalt-zinc-cadmium efflux system protein